MITISDLSAMPSGSSICSSITVCGSTGLSQRTIAPPQVIFSKFPTCRPVIPITDTRIEHQISTARFSAFLHIRLLC